MPYCCSEVREAASVARRSLSTDAVNPPTADLSSTRRARGKYLHE